MSYQMCNKKVRKIISYTSFTVAWYFYRRIEASYSETISMKPMVYHPRGGGGIKTTELNSYRQNP